MRNPAETIGPYRIARLIGQGATSTVYEATDARGAPLALKVLHHEHRTSDDLLSRFVNEALPIVQERLMHPSLPRIFAVEIPPDSAPYIAMELLGPSMAQRLQRGPLPTAEALRVVAQVAGALAYLHQRHIVHRDVKPGNLLDPPPGQAGPVKLIDLGLAKLPAAELPVFPLSTAAGHRCGTPEYRAPEQWLCAKAVSDRADIYSLGIVLHELISGAPPFRADSIGRLRLEHTLRPAPPLQVPEPLRGLAHAMLAKDPRARPSAAEVAAALAP